ncbi:MAG: flavodoxin family protein [Coriobacteriia bacterium]|nr:flavodoxin family protein [Coriobacteriia bacterium]
MRRPLVIALAGSPRPGGNSDCLLEEFVAGVRDAGADADLVAARDLVFAACDGCGGCFTSGRCVHRDDADAFLERLDAADGLVVASPVYFAGVPAVLKAVLDRMQPCWARTYRLGQPRRPKRPGAYLLVGAGGDPFGTAGAEATLSSAMQVCGFSVDVAGRFVGLDGPDDARRDADLRARVRAMGADFAAGVLEGAARR